MKRCDALRKFDVFTCGPLTAHLQAPKMFSAKKTTAFKASRDTSATASKIKQKILNTSSFFKVSLKTNNRALALALEAQKEQTGQLEKEVVYLQKQVAVLWFELAARKYRHRKLFHLLKGFHSDTLERLSEAAELLGDVETPEQSEDHRSRLDVTKRSFRLHDPPWSEFPFLDSAIMNEAGHSNETCRRDTKASSSDRQRSYDQAKESDWHSLTHLPSTSHSFVSLGVGEEPPCTATQGFDVNATSNLKRQQPLGQHLTAGEKTMLLNTTMEMTVCNAGKIIAVETRAKKTSRSRQAKGEMVRKQGCQDAESLDAGTSNATTQETKSPADQLMPKDARNTAPVPECPPSHIQLKGSAPSRIPKVYCHQDRVKHPDPPGSNNTTQHHADVDDNFSVPNVNSLTFVRSDSGEKSPKFSRKQSRTKIKKVSLVPGKTINTPSPGHAESCQSTSSAPKEHPEEFRFCEDDEKGFPESRQGPPFPPETSFSAVNYSRGSSKSRCRSTFFLVSDTTSSDRVLLGQDPIPPAGSDSVVWCRPNNGTKSGKSWKRPWTATEELCGGDRHGPLPPTNHHSSTGPDVQICKRAGREEATRSNKTKPKSHVDHDANKTVKNQEKAHGNNQEVTPENKVCDRSPPSATTQTCCPSPITGPERLCLRDSTDNDGSRSRLVLLPAMTTSKLRETNVDGVGAPDRAARGQMGDPPPWLDMGIGAVGADGLSLSASWCRMEEATAEDSSTVLVDPEGGAVVEPFRGRVLTTLTNTVTPPGGEPPGRTKRSHYQVCYKEPPLNRKMRREESGLMAGHGRKKRSRLGRSCGSPVKD